MSHRATPGAVRQSILCATMIRNLRLGNPQAMNDAIVGSLIPNVFRSVYVAANDDRPSIYYAANATDGVLVLDGTSTMAQASKIIDGYVGGVLDSVTEPQNYYYDRGAELVVREFTNRGIRFPLGMTYAGHSMGGAMIGYVAARVNQRNQWGVSSYTYTFGAPRPGGPNVRIAIESQGQGIRWMNDNDPVPIVPPRIEDFPGILPIFGVRGCIRAGHFVHRDGGIDIGPAGNLTQSILPIHATANFITDLAAWLRSWDDGTRPAHSINEYIDRLTLTQQLLSPNARPVLADAERPADARADQINRQERGVLNTILHLERQQNGVAVNIPKDLGFRAVRISRIWYVLYGDAVVATPGSKRSARRLARQGNDWLRSLQRTAVVDPLALVQAFNDYIMVAQDPGSGVAPVMNTVFPAS